MKFYLKQIAAAGVIAALPAIAPAVTVTVDGAGGTATTFAKLSEAVTYVNANSSEPNIINVTADTTDDGQIVISVPVTINGSAVPGTPSDIAVDVAAIKGSSDAGATNYNYIEVATAGNVTINDLQIHPIQNGSTTSCDPIAFYKPAADVGEYVLNRVHISGSDGDGNYIPATVPDPYYVSGVKRWYAYLSSRGIYNITNDGGAGSYNVTLNNCHGSIARSHVVRIANQSGTTTINSGIYSGAGEDNIRIDGATGVTIAGTAINRVILSAPNSSSNGVNMRVLGAAVVDEISYVDFVNCDRRVNLGLTPVSGSGLAVVDGTITDMNFCRAANLGGYPLQVLDGTVNVSDSTFYANGGDSTASPAVVGAPEPVRIDGGTVSFTDSIFASQFLGQILINGGTANFTNNAIPTDGDAEESLNTTNPFSAAPASNTTPISDSPTFATSAYTLTEVDNLAFLRPTEPSYLTAHTGGTPLYGGAGVDLTGVNDWNLY